MKLLQWSFLLIFMASCSSPSTSYNTASPTDSSTVAPTVTPEEARAIAREAYTYGYPMLDSYRIQFAYFIAKDNTEYKGSWNTLASTPRVYTDKDTTVQTPNSDTPYSMIGFDLRTEPIVLSFPKMDKNRYFSVQLVDAYTHNFNYLGTRTTGNDGGSYLIAGPDWKGEKPAGIKEIIRSETQFALGIYRTQLFNPADLENVKKIQSQYKAEPLSAFLKQTPPQPASPIAFPAPLSIATQRTSLQFFPLLNFLLGYCPTHPSEKELMERFARINVGANKNFDSTSFSPEVLNAIRMGIKDAWMDFQQLRTQFEQKKISSGDVFGTREALKNDYQKRMAAAVIGIYGNTKDEAMYPSYALDGNGNPLTGANKYTLRFSPGNFPPVTAFWSLTMYRMPASLLVKNPINRFLINSPMLPQLKKDKDGGITIYIQNASPGKDKESNWLPAPQGPFQVFMRLYGPKPEALSGAWTQPPLMLAD